MWWAPSIPRPTMWHLPTKPGTLPWHATFHWVLRYKWFTINSEMTFFFHEKLLFLGAFPKHSKVGIGKCGPRSHRNHTGQSQCLVWVPRSLVTAPKSWWKKFLAPAAFPAVKEPRYKVSFVKKQWLWGCDCQAGSQAQNWMSSETNPSWRSGISGGRKRPTPWAAKHTKHRSFYRQEKALVLGCRDNGFKYAHQGC